MPVLADLTGLNCILSDLRSVGQREVFVDQIIFLIQDKNSRIKSKTRVSRDFKIIILGLDPTYINDSSSIMDNPKIFKIYPW